MSLSNGDSVGRPRGLSRGGGPPRRKPGLVEASSADSAYSGSIGCSLTLAKGGGAPPGPGDFGSRSEISVYDSAISVPDLKRRFDFPVFPPSPVSTTRRSVTRATASLSNASSRPKPETPTRHQWERLNQGFDLPPHERKGRVYPGLRPGAWPPPFRYPHVGGRARASRAAKPSAPRAPSPKRTPSGAQPRRSHRRPAQADLWQAGLPDQAPA